MTLEKSHGKLTNRKIIEILKRDRALQEMGKVKTRYGKQDKSKDNFTFSEELAEEQTE